MSANIRGVQPLKWGTNAISGYVNEGEGEDESTGQFLIEDEGGDVITEITGFGLKTDVNLEVIPKSTVTTPPVAGEVLSYGSKKCVILSINKKRAPKNVEKWTIKGSFFPGVSLTS